MTNLDVTFRALGDETRREILARLRHGETVLSELAEPFAMSQTAVSKHVRILRDAGLLDIEKRGRTRYCRLRADPLQDASGWLDEYQTFWNQQVENLTDYFEAEGDT